MQAYIYIYIYIYSRRWAWIVGMDNWKYWIIGCQSKHVHGVLLEKTIHQESKKQLKKVHNTEQLVPRITESKDIHVVGRWLRICTHISYDYLSHAASKIQKVFKKKHEAFFSSLGALSPCEVQYYRCHVHEVTELESHAMPT